MAAKKGMLMGQGEKTKLVKANDNSHSLRTTVPKGIVTNFDLKEGDSVHWVIRPSENGKGLMIVVTTEKAKKPKSKVGA